MSAAIRQPVEIAGQRYVLTWKFGTLRYFEQEIGRPAAEVFGTMSGTSESETSEQAAQRIPLDVWSALFWAALQPSHRLTREATDDLIDEVGLGQAVEWVLRGMAAYNAGDPSLLTRDLAGKADSKPAGKGGAAGERKPGKHPAS